MRRGRLRWTEIMTPSAWSEWYEQGTSEVNEVHKWLWLQIIFCLTVLLHGSLLLLHTMLLLSLYFVGVFILLRPAAAAVVVSSPFTSNDRLINSLQHSAPSIDLLDEELASPRQQHRSLLGGNYDPTKGQCFNYVRTITWSLRSVLNIFQEAVGGWSTMHVWAAGWLSWLMNWAHWHEWRHEIFTFIKWKGVAIPS